MAVNPAPVKIELRNKELWGKFKDVVTEMIITKKGRRMFPAIKLTINGLVPNHHYLLVLDFVVARETKCKFDQETFRWTTGAPADFAPIEGSYVHPPAKGCELMNTVVSFHRLKLTNENYTTPQKVALKSKHLYVPRLHVYETPDTCRVAWHYMSTVVLHQAEFVAVTSYNNRKLCQLKIDNNPFARAFRNSAKRRRPKKADSTTASGRIPVSGTLDSTHSFQMACEESPTSGCLTEGESSDSQAMCISTSGTSSLRDLSEEEVSSDDYSNETGDEKMVYIADFDPKNRVPSEINDSNSFLVSLPVGERENTVEVLEVEGYPIAMCLEPVAEPTDGCSTSPYQTFPPASTEETFDAINSLESFCFETCSSFNRKRRKGLDSRNDLTNNRPSAGSHSTRESQSSIEEKSTEELTSEELACVNNKTSFQFPGGRRRKAIPRRLLRENQKTKVKNGSNPKGHCQDIFEEQFLETQDIPKEQSQETQDIPKEQSQETQDIPKEQSQETQDISEEQSQETQDNTTEQYKGPQDKGDLCDVTWLTSLGSVMNVDDGSSTSFLASGAESADSSPVTTTCGANRNVSRSFFGSPYLVLQCQPSSTQTVPRDTSSASYPVACDVNECIPRVQMSPSVVPCDVSPEYHETMRPVTTAVVETYQPLTGEKLKPMAPAHEKYDTNRNSAGSSTANKQPATSPVAQKEHVTHIPGFSFINGEMGPGSQATCDVSGRDSITSTWNTQNSSLGYPVSTELNDDVIQTQTPVLACCTSLWQDNSASSSLPVIVSVYSVEPQQSQTLQGPGPGACNTTQIDLSTAIPRAYEGERNLTEDITNASSWRSPETQWLVTRSSGPVPVNSHNLTTQAGQRHCSEYAVFHEESGMHRMNSIHRGGRLDFNRSQAGVIEPSYCHRPTPFPVALEAYYSFPAPRPKDATVRQPKSNRHYKPTRTIFSRLSLEPVSSVLPLTPYGWQEPETRFPYWS